MNHRQVTSKDGTKIAVYKSGSGKPLIVVHGGGSDYTRWKPVLPMLTKSFTVYAVERRGRGESANDADDYAIEREYEDIAAVAASIPEPVYVLGHSYGAICALGAALQIANLQKLVLYEPPIAYSPSNRPEGFIERLRNLIDSGDRERAVSFFSAEILNMTPPQLEAFRLLPQW
jgi:pimeloyl-ACP methyl ester carboxylesterase